MILKQPTISIYRLVDEEYQVSQFRIGDSEALLQAVRILSPTFPELTLRVEKIIQSIV